MGCKASRIKEDVVIAVPTKREPEVKRTDDNVHGPGEEVSEYSLRECSLIPIQMDIGGKRRASEDPSIYAFIQEIS